jgi:2-isopropylmalate synthase
MSRPISLFDTTLRDGEQAPGAALAPHEKVRAALQLERLGVDTVEAGFPASSAADAAAVADVARHTSTVQIAALARALPADIQAAAAALAPAIPSRRALLHVFLGTSPLQLKRLGMAPDAILDRIRASVALARTLCPAVLFSAEDATRTPRPFLIQALSAALEAGATALCVPDTVGYATPADFASLVPFLLSSLPPLATGAVPLHVHCHDDLGLALPNTLSALAAGAAVAHVTLNGIGERAGNCPLEELAVALATRPDAYPFAAPRLALRELYPSSRLLSQLTGYPVPRNKAVVGSNAFAHEAGVHQQGLLKDRDTYEIVHPETIGRAEGYELVLGRHSGRAGFVDHLVRLGLDIPPDRLEALYSAFMELAEKKQTVYDDDLVELLREHLSSVPRVWTLRALQVTAGHPSIPTATVQLEKNGTLSQDSATGAGPVDAAFQAIDRITGIPGVLKSFNLQAVTRGQDALGEVTLQASFASAPPLTAKASDTDIILASAKAYLNALNRHLSTT